MTPRSEQAPIARLEAQRRAGRPAEAERLARRELERDPGSARLRAALALALLDQGRVDAARDELERGAGRRRPSPRPSFRSRSSRQPSSSPSPRPSS